MCSGIDCSTLLATYKRNMNSIGFRWRQTIGACSYLLAERV
jgi:hypothetical protein